MYYVRACDYIIANFPLEDEVLDHAYVALEAENSGSVCVRNVNCTSLMNFVNREVKEDEKLKKNKLIDKNCFIDLFLEDLCLPTDEQQ